MITLATIRRILNGKDTKFGALIGWCLIPYFLLTILLAVREKTRLCQNKINVDAWALILLKQIYWSEY